MYDIPRLCAVPSAQRPRVDSARLFFLCEVTKLYFKFDFFFSFAETKVLPKTTARGANGGRKTTQTLTPKLDKTIFWLLDKHGYMAMDVDGAKTLLVRELLTALLPELSPEEVNEYAGTMDGQHFIRCVRINSCKFV